MPNTNCCILSLVLFLMVAPAPAHVTIASHKPRHDRTTIKDGPCGELGSERGEIVHEFEPGETIQLAWDEFTSHPGYFRISFDADGEDDFVDPSAFFDFHTNDAVLADNLFPHEQWHFPVTYRYDLKLPDTTCENCTLQLIQMMTDKAPYQPGTNDIYYSCLDIQLTSVPEPNSHPWLLGILILYLTQRRGREKTAEVVILAA